MVNAAPRLLYPPGKRPGNRCIGVWVGKQGAENLAPTGIRSPDRPARSELLYRLSHSGPRRLFSVSVKFYCQIHILPLYGGVFATKSNQNSQHFQTKTNCVLVRDSRLFTLREKELIFVSPPPTPAKQQVARC